MRRNGFLNSFIAMVVAVLLTSLCYADKKPVKPKKQWRGTVADETLVSGAPTYIATAEELEKLWTNWKLAGKKPEVNFSKDLVVLTTSRGSGLSLVTTLDENGDLAVHGLGTMDIRPGFRVITQGNPTKLEVVVQMVKSGDK